MTEMSQEGIEHNLQELRTFLICLMISKKIPAALIISYLPMFSTELLQMSVKKQDQEEVLETIITAMREVLKTNADLE